MSATKEHPMTEIAVSESSAIIDLRDLKAGLQARAEMVTAIKSFMGSLLKKGVHYDAIPGTDKDTLLQPGAEDLILAAKAHLEIVKEEVRILPENHMDVTYTAQIVKDDGRVLGQSIGSCSTMESKYRWRFSARKCPGCGAEAIIKGKAEYGGGWVCFKRKNGCGAKYKDGDTAIESQTVGRVPNEDVADVWNTVKKMAQKRAFVGAAKVSFGVSSLFTQDVEDLAPNEDTPGYEPPARPAEPPKKAQKPAKQPPVDVAGALDEMAAIKKDISSLLGRHAAHSGVPRLPDGRFESKAYSDHYRSVVTGSLGGRANATSLDDFRAIKKNLEGALATIDEDAASRTNDLPFDPKE